VSSQLHSPTVLTTREQNPEPNEYEAEWAQGPVLTLQRETLSFLPGIESKLIDRSPSQ